MKKLFGRDKDKTKQQQTSRGVEVRSELSNVRCSYSVQDTPLSTPIHQQHAVYREHDEERWEVVDGNGDAQRAPGISPSRASSFTSLPPGAGPPIPVPRSPSPYGQQQKQGYQPPPPPSNHLKKKAPIPGTILRALEPELAPPPQHNRKESSDRDNSKKGFWGRDKESHEFWRELGEDGLPSLTRQIGACGGLLPCSGAHALPRISHGDKLRELGHGPRSLRPRIGERWQRQRVGASAAERVQVRRVRRRSPSLTVAH